MKMCSSGMKNKTKNQKQTTKENQQTQPFYWICAVLGRGSWLSAMPSALIPGWHSVWNTEALRGSGEHPQEAVWLRSECTWNTNSSFHSCAGTTPACLFQITNPGSTAETQPQSLCSHLLLWVLFFQVLLTFQNFR